MPVNNKPIFGGVPIVNVVTILEATTSNGGTNGVIADPDTFATHKLYKIFEAGANGGFIDCIDYQAIYTGTYGTPGATLMNVWVTDSNGVNARVINTITVAPGTLMSATNRGVSQSTTLYFANLGPGQKAYVSFTLLASNISYTVTAYCGQFAAQI